MKMNEIHNTDAADEPFESHTRTAVKVGFDLSFAHENGLEPAFKELLEHGYFQSQLEAAFAAKFKELAQKMIMSSKIPPGHGWMDDIETGVVIQVGASQRID